MAGIGGILAGSAYVKLYADQSEYVRGLRTAEQKLSAFGNAVGTIGRRMTMLAAAAAAPIALSAKTFGAFQDQLLAVQAVTRATGKDFDKLYEQGKRLGASTSFTATQVGSGQLNLGRAGFSPDEIEASIPGVLDLARATGTELAEAAEIAAGTLRAFNLEAREMPRVVDVMTATANNSAQTLTELGESMSYAAPIAYEYGLSVEQTAKALGVLANMSIKGSMAGTSLRQIMLRLSDPAVQKRLGELGIEAVDAVGNLRPLGDVMIAVGKAMAKMGTGERLAFGKELFDQRAVGSAMKLANTDFPALEKAIDNAAGSAKEAADIMDSGLGGAFRMLMSAVEGVQIAIGEALTDELTQSMDTLQEYAVAAAQWVKENQSVVTSILEITAVVGAAGIAIVGIGATINGMAAICGAGALAVTGLSSAFAFLLANPVVATMAAVGVAVAGVTAAVVALDEELETVSNRATDVAHVNSAARKSDRDKLARLEELKKKAETESLTRQEKQEALNIQAELKPRYTDMGTPVTRGMGPDDFSIGDLGGAKAAIAAKQRADAIADMQAAVDEEKRNMAIVADKMKSTDFGTKEMDALTIEYQARERRLELLNDKLAVLQGGSPNDIDTSSPSRLDSFFGEGGAGASGRSTATPPSMTPEEAAKAAEELATRITELRIAAMEDGFDKELALINARYDAEMKKAEGLKEILDQLAEARKWEISNSEAEHQKKRDEEKKKKEEEKKKADQAIQDEIDRQNIENTWAAQLPGDMSNEAKRNYQRDQALLEQERQAALRDAAATGADTGKINELYDARAKALEFDFAESRRQAIKPSEGTYSAAASFRAGMGAPAEDKTVKATKDVEKKVERGNKLLENIEKNTRGGGMGS